MLESVAEELVDIRYTASELTGVNEIEFLVVGPLLFEIKNFESTVRRYPVSGQHIKPGGRCGVNCYTSGVE
jgi:hypothetical protein